MSRQSVWPSAPPPTDYLNYLEDCISATENCVTSLHTTLGKFGPGIQDFPRLSRVLVNEHVSLYCSFWSYLDLHIVVVGQRGKGRQGITLITRMGVDIPEIPSFTINNNPNPPLINLCLVSPRYSETTTTSRNTSRRRTNKITRYWKNNQNPSISFTPLFLFGFCT